MSLAALPGSSGLLFESFARLDIALSSAQDQLQSVDEPALLDGANRLLLGEEILQFRFAEPLGGGHWRLTGLLRGRAGTEHSAAAGHPAGAPAVLLDRQLIALQDTVASEIAAESGLAGAAPVYASLAGAGTSLRPLPPVHPCRVTGNSGDPAWHWIRRARGAWRWLDGVDVPLAEEREAYRIGFGPVDDPVSQWDVSEPVFTLPAAEWSSLIAANPSAQLWVRQVGSHAVSLPTLLPR